MRIANCELKKSKIQNPKSKILIVGLTGGIATGKTTTANIFRRLGATVIDVDEIAHEVVKPGTKPYQEIVHTFGSDVLNLDQSINRPKLASLIFKDKIWREKLNKITHPAIIKEMKKRAKLLPDQSRGQVSSLSPIGVEDKFPVIVDIPLLFEINLTCPRSELKTSFFDKIIVVKCSEMAQIECLKKRDGLSTEEARQRMASQLPLEAKIRRANFCIDNNGTFEETEKQVKKVWKELLSCQVTLYPSEVKL